MKSQIVIAFLLIAALGMGVVGYNYLYPPQAPAQTDVRPEAAPVTGQVNEVEGASFSEAAGRIQAFIDSRRTGDGFYKYSFSCENDPQGCGFASGEVELIYPTSNSWTALSNLGIYKMTGDGSRLDRAKADADKLIEWCSADPRMCLWVLSQVSELEKETGDSKYSSFLMSQGEMLLSIDDDTDSEIVGQRNSRMMLGIEARELAQIYGLAKDQRYIDEAERRIQESASDSLPDVTVVYEFDGNKYTTMSCWTHLANAQIAEATGDGAYTQRVESFLSAFKPAQNVVYMSFMTDLQPCAELYQMAADLTGKDEYRSAAASMASSMLDRLWDTPENIFANGNDAVLTSSASHVDTITDNAYMVWLLSKDEGVIA